jgi:hypothetical protein
LKKIKYLRSQYGEELKKTKQAKSGMSTDDMYISKWKFFQPLQFLQQHVTLRRSATTTNLDVVSIILPFIY